MPDLAGLFSHVLVDVSSIKTLCDRWYPRGKDLDNWSVFTFEKNDGHVILIFLFLIKNNKGRRVLFSCNYWYVIGNLYNYSCSKRLRRNQRDSDIE